MDIAAANEGIGRSSAPMMGVGMGMGMAPFISQTMSSFGNEIQGSSLMTPITEKDSANINVTPSDGNEDGDDIPGMVHLKTSVENTCNEKHHIDDEEYMKRLKRLKMAWQEGLYTDEEFKIEREKLKDL